MNPPQLQQAKLTEGIMPHFATKLADNRFSIADPASAVMSIDEAAMSARFVISSVVPDRVGDVMVPEGCYLENYRKNPVVLFGHNMVSLLPMAIGKSEDPAGNLAVQIFPGQRVEATCFFSQKTLEGRNTFDLVTEKILRGASIGFAPMGEGYERLGDDSPHPFSPTPGFKFLRWELQEWSLCNVAMNQECGLIVRSHLERGKIGGEKIAPSIRKSLEAMAEPKRAWTPGIGAGEMAKQKNPQHAKGSYFGKTALQVAVAAKKAKDAMAETDGSEGGDTVPDAASMKAGIIGVMEKYKDHTTDHAAWMHAGKMGVHHRHKADDDPAMLGEMKDAFTAISGVKEVTQGDMDPEEEGYEKAYPTEEASGGEAEIEAEGKAFDLPAMDLQIAAIHELAKAAGLRVTVRKDDAATEEVPVAGETTVETDEALETAEVEEQAEMTLGALCLQALIEHLAEKTPLIEQEQVRAFYEEVLASSQELAAETYPEWFDSMESQTPEEEAAEAQADGEETDLILDTYRAKPPAWFKVRLSRHLKRLNKRHKACVKDAAEHLGELGELETGTPIKASHKTASKAHHKALVGILKEAEMGMDEEEEEKGIDMAAVAKALGNLHPRMVSLDEQFYQLTGKKPA